MASTYDVKPDIKNDKSGWRPADNGQMVITASRGFTILLDEGSTDTSETVRLNATDLPQHGSAHPSNQYLFADAGADIQKVSPIYYTAIVNYESEPFEQGNQDISPIDLPLVWNVESVTTEEVIDEDANGNSLENAGTGEPWEGVTIPVTDQILNIHKNVATFDPVTFSAYYNRVNSDAVPIGSGYPVGVCRIVDVTEEQASSSTIPYFVIKVKIQVRWPYRTTPDKAWYLRRKKVGFYEWTGRFLPPTPDFPSGRPEIIRSVDAHGREVTKPVLLDAAGMRLVEGGAPHYDEVQRFDTVAFASMGLW